MNQYVADALAKIEASRYSDATTAALSALRGSGDALSGASRTVQAQGGLPMGATGELLRQLLMLQKIRAGAQKPDANAAVTPPAAAGDLGSSSEVLRDRAEPDPMSDVAYPDLFAGSRV
jgi:hypothetical protein